MGEVKDDVDNLNLIRMLELNKEYEEIIGKRVWARPRTRNTYAMGIYKDNNKDLGDSDVFWRCREGINVYNSEFEERSPFVYFSAN